MEWIELSLPAGPLVDEIAALIISTEETASEGVEIRGESIVYFVPRAEADAAVASLKAAAARLRDQGFEVGEPIVKPAPPEDEWRDGWKKYFHVTRLGKRIVIVPSWEQFTPGPDDVVLDLDPGRAFGTGAHASTKLCLMEAERVQEGGLKVNRFLDAGTGSGILSIAACKLWPDAAGVAVDVDPIAVGAAQENCERNGVAGRMRISEDAVSDVNGPFELIFANIQADILEELRDAIVDKLAPGGFLVLSGLLTAQAEPVAKKYAPLTVLRIDPLEDWSAVVLQK